MTELQLAAIVVIGYFVVDVLREITKLTVSRIFKKTVDTEYMTAERCRVCREECAATRNRSDDEFDIGIDELGMSLDAMREVILAIGIKVGVDESLLRQLVHKRRSSDR